MACIHEGQNIWKTFLSWKGVTMSNKLLVGPWVVEYKIVVTTHNREGQVDEPTY